MRIQALNVSLPKVIVYKGEEVLTGIYKVSTAEPLMVRKFNIDGDKQADLTVHGGVDKAVYAFPAEHYSYYQEAL
jgi:MOSC domain-containing protein YiiM